MVLSPEAGRAPLTVAISTEILHPDCYSYLVDWGEGGASERSPGFAPQKQCDRKKVSQQFMHTYRKPGRYVIRWHDNEADPFREAPAGPGYLEREVRVAP